MKYKEEEYFKRLNRVCAEVLKTVIEWNPYVFDDYDDIDLDQEGAIAKTLMEQIKAHPEIKDAYNSKYEWGK
jgi:hypothetical protein